MLTELLPYMPSDIRFGKRKASTHDVLEASMKRSAYLLADELKKVSDFSIKWKSSFPHVIERAKQREVLVYNVPAALNELREQKLCEFLFCLHIPHKFTIEVFYKDLILLLTKVPTPEGIVVNLGTVLSQKIHNLHGLFDTHERIVLE